MNVKALILTLSVAALAACGGVAPAPQEDPEVEAQGRNVIRVNTTSGEFNSDGDCSLREAMVAAHKNRSVDACPAGHRVAEDVIELQANATYTLYEVDNDRYSPNGLPRIETPSDGTNALFIRGNNATIERATDAPRFRIFDAVNGLRLDNLTIRNGFSVGTKMERFGFGGGLRLRRTLDNEQDLSVEQLPFTLYNVRFENNEAFSAGTGGGAFISGKAKLSRLTVRGNKASDIGGGLAVSHNVALLDSLIINNEAPTGGGISVLGSYEDPDIVSLIVNTSIIDNEGRSVAGISARNAKLYGVTVSANWGGGPGILAQATDIYNSTIAFNQGIGITYSNDIIFRNTIIANNERDCSRSRGSHPDIDYVSARSRYSLDSDKSCSLRSGSGYGNFSGSDPVLKPLATIGSDIRLTHALHSLSPAVNRGDPNFSVPPGLASEDGRGAARVWFGRVDIGAYESLETYKPPFLGK